MKNKLKLIGGKNLLSPKGLETRPTTSRVRESIRNILRERVSKCNWLDLCSGSGVMSCEALQMGARRVLAVELNKVTASICKSNLISTASELVNPFHLEVICNEVGKILKKGCKNNSLEFIKEFPAEDFRFDFVYIDPPYRSNLYSIILENLLLGNWLRKDAIAICEHSTQAFPKIPDKWLKLRNKTYGNTCIQFLTPNPALHHLYDIDSKLPQKGQG